MLASYNGVGRNLYTIGQMHVSGEIEMWDWKSVKLAMAIDDWQTLSNILMWQGSVPLCWTHYINDVQQYSLDMSK